MSGCSQHAGRVPCKEVDGACSNMNQKLKISGRDFLGYLLLGISVIMLLRSLTLCFSSDIWYDELFTVGMIQYTYGELINFTAQDVHPPLYYMIVKFFVDLCKLMLPGVHAVAVAKIVSVMPYFVLLFYSVTLIRRRLDIFVGGLFLFCVIAMPQLSSYTVEVRMYSWALMFVAAAFLHGHEAVWDRKDGKRTVIRQRLHGCAMACYCLAAAYTQYFAAVAAVMVYLYVLFELLRRDRRRIWEWILWVSAAAAGYAAWLMVLYRQITKVNANYWILPLSFRSLGGCVKFLMKPAFTSEGLNVVLAVVLTGVYAAVFLYHVTKLFHNRRVGGKKAVDHRERVENAGEDPVNEERSIWMAAGVFVVLGVIGFGFAASLLVRPIFVYRYMIPALGCFWLSFAAGLGEIWQTGRKSKARSLFSVAAVFLVVVIGLRDYRAFRGEEEYKILLMEQTSEALSSIAQEDIVVYNFEQVQAVTAYYLPEETESYLWCGTPESLIQEIIRPFGVVEETEVLQKWCEEGKTVWFIGSFNSRDAIVEEWRGCGLQVEEKGSYLLERYWFNLYKISI